MFQSKWFHNALIIILILLILGLLLWACSSGTKAAKSNTILKDTNAIVQGFNYFYQDQNRYPTTDEFSNDNLMRGYISNFPPQTFASSLCPKTYDYYNATPTSYELRVCLPKSAGGYRAGWNVFKK